MEYQFTKPWKIYEKDDLEALSFGKSLFPQVADTILEELKREICSENHPLYKTEVTPIGYDHYCKKDFVFEVTGNKIAIVHFTWHSESDGKHPDTIFFDSFKEAKKTMNRVYKPWWKLW